MPGAQESEIVARGSKTIICAMVASGKRPANEDLAALSEKERTRVQALFDLFAESGRIWNKEKFKRLDGTELYEFKNRELRFLCFWDSRGRLALTHMFRKSGKKTPSREIDRATGIRTEHEASLKKEAERGGMR